MPAKPAFSLSIVQPANRTRNIYFESEGAMRHWHELILDRQGYLECRISAYELISVIGQGTYGTVSLARHKNSQKEYAIKTVPIAKLRGFDESIEPRLMQKLTELGSPGIVTTYETFQCAG